MTKDIRKNIDATVKLNESLEESLPGWTGNKLAKIGGRLASKVTWGGTKQKLKKGVNIRADAEEFIKTWNTTFGARKMKRTPMNVIKFMSKHMKISRDQLKTAWNSTPQLTTLYGTYDDVVNQLKKQPGTTEEAPGDRRQPQAPRERASILSSESIEEASTGSFWSDTPRQTRRALVTQKMSVDAFRNLIIKAINVKNASEAEQELGGLPNIEKPEAPIAEPTEPRVAEPTKPTEPRVDPAAGMPSGGKANPEAQLKPSAEDLKQAGARDMDKDGDYDWDDIAQTAVAQGKGEEALSSIMKAIDPETASLVKQVLRSTSKGRSIKT